MRSLAVVLCMLMWARSAKPFLIIPLQHTRVVRCPPSKAHMHTSKSLVASFKACATEDMKGGTLVVATTHKHDEASENMAQALLRRTEWVSLGTEDGGEIFRCASAPQTHLWLRSDSMLEQDNIDKRFTQVTGTKPTDLLFVSKHASASGTPALTVHPIGNPGSSDAQAGGLPNRCPPPSTRLGSLYRRLVSQATSSGIAEEFDVSLEATHHGPWVESPALFAEIGSCAKYWGRRDVADFWADVLHDELRLGRGGGSDYADALTGADPCVAVVCLGGGHYAPKHGDAARREGVYLGHIMASYAFNMEGTDWQEAVKECVISTRHAYREAASRQGTRLVAHVDKKAFKASHREALIAYVEAELGMECVLRPQDIVSLVKSLSPAPL